MKITWLGHSCFTVESQGYKIVLDMEKYEQYRSNLPTGASEVVIDGGCHAGFCLYGAQDGDGTPTISSDEQINRTAGEIVRIILTAS